MTISWLFSNNIAHTDSNNGIMPATFLEVPDPAQHAQQNRRMSRLISRFVSGDSRSRIYGTMAGLYSLVAVSWYFPLTITKVARWL